MIALLDVNVLLALFDPAHVHHEAAHSWFAASRKDRWATCPLTENAFVRILSHPSYPGQTTTMEDAVSRLNTFCAEREHVFWPDAVSICGRGRFRWPHVRGHRQLTDVYLLALAISNHGRLATFETSISLKAVEGATAQNLAIISA